MRRAAFILAGNPLTLLGVVLVMLVVMTAALADVIAPFPEHRGAVVDFLNFNKPPGGDYLMGTDVVGRDLFSRIL
jgi:peptide/nickel transport system permease protein